MKCCPPFGFLSFFALLISVLSLNGCLVGAYRVSAPDRLPSKSLQPLTRPISFDVCVPDDVHSPSMAERRRRAIGDRVQSALAQAGVPAELRSSAESPVDLTITRLEHRGNSDWSFLLSLLTLSVVPGYDVQTTTLEVDFAAVDAAKAGESKHLQYQSRAALFMWLPLIVQPDVVGGLGGGWESSKKKDAAFNQMVERLGDDIRARLGRDGETPPTSGEGARACPQPSSQ